MKSKIYLLIAAAGIVAASSCKKLDTSSLGNKSINSLNAKADTDVYVVGESSPDNWPVTAAVYWKNGVRTALTDTTNSIVRVTRATGIAVHDTDVYITGTTKTDPYEKLTAVYWRNRKMTVLADNAIVGSQQNIAVSSCGCDVYIVGAAYIGRELKAVYWKNGVQHVLPSRLRQTVANSIVIRGGNVYIAGYARKNSADLYGLYWKNDTLHYLTDTLSNYSIAYGIDVKGNDVYISGYSHFVNRELVGGTAVATYWKNGMPVLLNGATPTIGLTIGLNDPNAVAINNGNIYVTGDISAPAPARLDAAYWVNNMINHFPPIDNEDGKAASFIAFAGHDVYISGTSYKRTGNLYAVAGYWKNGNAFVALPGQWSLGRGIAVVTHPHH